MAVAVVSFDAVITWLRDLEQKNADQAKRIDSLWEELSKREQERRN
jgi:hypothetical protein